MQVPFVRSLQPQLCAGLQPFLGSFLVHVRATGRRRNDGDSTTHKYGLHIIAVFGIPLLSQGFSDYTRFEQPAAPDLPLTRPEPEPGPGRTGPSECGAVNVLMRGNDIDECCREI